MRSHNAIQFIGTQRSGSNLLRVMLNQLPEISAPHPPHIIKTFFPLLHFYGDLSNSRNFFTLVSDVCQWVNNNPVPWEGVVFDPEDILCRCEKQDLIHLFAAIYQKKADVDGAKYWCCKSMESIHHINEMEGAGLHPFYIYLYRDGRDVALSFKKAIVGPKHVYSLASKWKEEQELSLQLLETLPPARFIMIRYENLISSHQNDIREICNKLNIPFADSVFDYFLSTESKNTASAGAMWQNVAKPIMGDNRNKYEREFSREDQVLFETVAGDVLERLGYPIHFWPDVPALTAEQIQEYNRQDRKLRDEAIKVADPADVSKRRQQEDIIDQVKGRSKSF